MLLTRENTVNYERARTNYRNITIVRYFAELPSVNQMRCALSYTGTREKNNYTHEKSVLTQSYPLDTRNIAILEAKAFHKLLALNL